jgi:RNA polymerase sigma-70 factor (ECF subfamily)
VFSPGEDKKYDLFVEYVKENQQNFYRLAFSYVKNEDAALDIVQEAITKALYKIHTLRQTQYMKTWFYRIIINECMNYFRTNKAMTEFDDNLENLMYESKDVSESLDLYKAIDQLELKLKTVIILRFYEDMKLQDIAKATGTNLSTVKSRLYTALDRLKAIIGEI